MAYHLLPSKFRDQSHLGRASAQDEGEIQTQIDNTTVVPKLESTDSQQASGTPSNRASEDLHRAKNASVSAESQELLGKNVSPSRPQKQRIRDSVGQVILACSLFLLPLTLSAILIYLVYKNLEPTAKLVGGFENTYTITENNRTRPIEASEYYVAYSATRLVLISSLSSTLALALVPVGIGLFTYCTAFALREASIREDYLRLPSPFQFELCLRILGGGALSIYYYLRYLARPRSHRVFTVPALNRSVLGLIALFALALSITVTDTLLHAKTSTVQYSRTTPSTSIKLDPGRQLPPNCNVSSRGYPCNISPGGSGAPNQLLGITEAYRILGNLSTQTSIGLSDDGLTSVLIPATVPANVGFGAQTYGSTTMCETITGRCDPHYTGGSYDASSQWGYDCKASKAGVSFAGNFTVNGLGCSSSTGGTTAFNWVFFNDTSGTVQIYSSTRPTFFNPIPMAMNFYLPSADIDATQVLGAANSTGQPTYYDPQRDLIRDTRGNVFGVVACNTTVSRVHYSMAVNGSISIVSSTPFNDDKTSLPFYDPFTFGYGLDNLRYGLSVASVSSSTGTQLAHQLARTIDRTVLGLTGGYMVNDTASDVFTVSSIQVTKLPIPEFVALIILNLLMSLSGIALAIAALYLRLREGVIDVQARLNTGALVAALFENKELDQTATSVEEMYAELRGMHTSRIIATDPNHDGGRIFVAVQSLKS